MMRVFRELLKREVPGRCPNPLGPMAALDAPGVPRILGPALCAARCGRTRVAPAQVSHGR